MRRFFYGTGFCILVLIGRQLHAYGGTVPSGYPSTFLMGMVDDDFEDACSEYGQGANGEVNTVAQWMSVVDPSHTGFQFSYRYLQGGFAADNAGWYAQYPGTGGALGNYANLCVEYGYLPVFIYYQIGEINDGYLTNATEMGKYYQDWSAAMQAINTWMNSHAGKVVTVDLEPDLAGWVQQSGNTPGSQTVEVSSATNPGGSAPYTQPTQANTYQGFCAALLSMKDKYVTGANNANLHIAFHVSGWAVANNPAAIGGQTNAALSTQASTIAGFVNACQPGSGSKFDLFFTDPSGYDGGYNATYNWDSGGAMAAQYATWLNDLSGDIGLRGILWQMPMGNSHMKNTLGHYTDTRPEYFLNDSPLNSSGFSHNLCYYYNSGCIGILWGRGDYHCTGVMDYFYPANYAGSTSQQDCATYSGTGSWSAPAVIDDDAGFFRTHIANNAAWGSSCLVSGTPTFTPTPTPYQSPTVSPTITLTPACPGGVVDDFLTNSLTDSWGGSVSAYNPGGGTTMNPSPFVLTAGGPAPSLYNAAISGSVSGTNYPSISTDLNASGTAQSVCTYNALQFSFNGNTGTSFVMQVHSSLEGGAFNDYYFDIVGTGSWETITIPFTSFLLPTWGTPYAFNCMDLEYLSWVAETAGSYSMAVDNIQFICQAATPTPSLTPTLTSSATPSPTPSKTLTASPTPSGTPTDSATASPSASPSGTTSATPSASASRSPSPSPSDSPTASASPSPTASVTLLLTSTPSPSATATPTETLTFSASPTLNGTRTDSPTDSPTTTLTPTFTQTPTPTASGTPTWTMLPSVTPSITPTMTFSFIATNTETATLMPTATVTPSPSPSSTPSETQTPASPTSTMTSTSSATETASPTTVPPGSTLTPTPTPTITASPVATVPGSGGSSGSLTGPDVVDTALPFPNPNPTSIYVKMEGPCDWIRIVVFSRAMTVVGSVQGAGAQGAGWVSVNMGSSLQSLANGIYYYSVTSGRQGSQSAKTYVGKLSFIR